MKHRRSISARSTFSASSVREGEITKAIVAERAITPWQAVNVGKPARPATVVSSRARSNTVLDQTRAAQIHKAHIVLYAHDPILPKYLHTPSLHQHTSSPPISHPLLSLASLASLALPDPLLEKPRPGPPVTQPVPPPAPNARIPAAPCSNAKKRKKETRSTPATHPNPPYLGR